MAIDYTFKIVNGEDTVNSATFASTGATAAARDVTSVSALSAEVTTALALTAQALAIVPKTITAAQYKKLAFTFLRLAGSLSGSDVDTAAHLADPEARNKFKIKKGLNEAYKVFEDIT